MESSPGVWSNSETCLVKMEIQTENCGKTRHTLIDFEVKYKVCPRLLKANHAGGVLPSTLCVIFAFLAIFAVSVLKAFLTATYAKSRKGPQSRIPNLGRY